MNLKDFVKHHNLIGSLLESILVNEDESSLYLEIDYCYWQQPNYNEDNEETAVLTFKFENCSFYYFDDHTINSDEIVKVEILNNELVICVESDLTGDYHNIRISAQNVLITKK